MRGSLSVLLDVVIVAGEDRQRDVGSAEHLPVAERLGHHRVASAVVGTFRLNDAVGGRRGDLCGVDASVYVGMLLLLLLLMMLRLFLMLLQLLPLFFLTTSTKLLLLLLLMMLRWLVAAKTLLVNASPRCLENLSVDHHHDDARQVKGTDG